MLVIVPCLLRQGTKENRERQPEEKRKEEEEEASTSLSFSKFSQKISSEVSLQSRFGN